VRPRLWPLACTLAVLLAGCTHLGPTPGSSSARDHSSITFNISEDPHTLNPVLAQSDDEEQIAHLAFDMLVDVDARGRLVPALATEVPTVANGGISAHGRTITYHLRRGVRWQGGAPFTPHDVWFTLRAVVVPRPIVE